MIALWGYLVVSRVLRNESDSVLLLHILVSLEHERVEFLKLLTFFFFIVIMLAKSSCLYRGRTKKFGKGNIYVSVNLFTTSVPHSR